MIEQAMVEGAERQPVRHLVGSAVGMPADVRGIDPDQAVHQAQREAAALGEIGLEYVRNAAPRRGLAVGVPSSTGAWLCAPTDHPRKLADSITESLDAPEPGYVGARSRVDAGDYAWTTR